MPIDWPTKLQEEATTHESMSGVTVMWDFSWSTETGKTRRRNERTFTGGKRLAALVAQECASVTGGKLTPALVLTVLPDEREGPRQENGFYAVIVNIRAYMDFARDRSRSRDIAAAYFALRCATPVSRLPNVQDLELSPEEVERLRPVVRRNREKFRALGELLHQEEATPAREPLSGADLVAALSTVEALADEDLNALVATLDRLGTPEVRRQAIQALLRFADGRNTAIGELGDAVESRIADARRALDTLRDAVKEPEALEAVFQTEIGKHPWILGLHYVRAFPQRDIGGSPVDFLLRRMDGKHDIVELKRAMHQVVELIPGKRSKYEGREKPPPAHAYQIGAELSNALAQTHKYRDWLVSLGNAATHLNLHVNEDPLITIIIGRVADLSPVERVIFDQFRRSLVRVSVVCYDELADQAGAVLDGVERHLLGAHAVLSADPPAGDNDDD